MSEYLFEYEFRGAEWSLAVEAETEAEAVEQVRAMGSAVLRGVTAERIPLRASFRPRVVDSPMRGLWRRIALSQWPWWELSAVSVFSYWRMHATH